MKVLPAQGPERRRTVALLAVLAALVAWVWWPAGQSGSLVIADSVPQAAGAAGGDMSAPTTLQTLTLPVRVRLEALGEEPIPLSVGRNLFRFGARPAPPPPPPMETPVVTAPPSPPRPMGPPPIPLRLTGRFEAPDGRVVVTLKDPSTGALFHATEGEIVDGRYRLLKVGTQSVVVSYLDGTGQRTIPLGG